jgi:hypothetical protein
MKDMSHSTYVIVKTALFTVICLELILLAGLMVWMLKEAW